MHLKNPDIIKLDYSFNLKSIFIVFELKVQIIIQILTYLSWMDIQWGFHMVYDYSQIIIVCQDDYLFNTILVLCLFKDI